MRLVVGVLALVVAHVASVFASFFSALSAPAAALGVEPLPMGTGVVRGVGQAVDAAGLDRPGRSVRAGRAAVDQLFSDLLGRHFALELAQVAISERVEVHGFAFVLVEGDAGVRGGDLLGDHARLLEPFVRVLQRDGGAVASAVAKFGEEGELGSQLGLSHGSLGEFFKINFKNRSDEQPIEFKVVIRMIV